MTSDIVERLRKNYSDVDSSGEAHMALEAANEIERLTAENENLRRWKALDKPIAAAMSIANSHIQPLRAEIERLTVAIQRIDGINDNPAVYNPDIEAVVRRALEGR